MNEENIRKIVDDERAEQLTAQLCRHWDVVSQRLTELAQDLEADLDTCVEAEVYAAMMRMQSSVMALMELHQMPCVLLFSEYLDRIAQSISNTSMRQSVMLLLQRMQTNQPVKQRASFFDMVSQTLAQHSALSKDRQAVINEQVSPMQSIFALCAQYLKPNELMMVAQIIQSMNAEGDATNLEETTKHLQEMRTAMDELTGKMDESLQMMLIWLAILMMLPELIVRIMKQRQADSKLMADVFNKVLARTRESTEWWNYWKERRETLRAERTKERTALGQVPGGLFAKWTTDRKAFDEFFLDAHLDDDALRHFIFHLATLSEIARELNPTSKFGDEQLVLDELQQVGDAVLEAASKLHDLVANTWFPHYEAMWQELIQDEEIFAHLKVTRKSPHNDLFTARFFCHLVGELKKSAVFGAHSDSDLAEKLTEKQYVGTFRKNIQEGMGNETKILQNNFDAIYQKYKALAHAKK